MRKDKQSVIHSVDAATGYTISSGLVYTTPQFYANGMGWAAEIHSCRILHSAYLQWV